MKCAISTIDCHIDNKPAPLFFKCRMFCIYDSELKRANYYENPFYDLPDNYEKNLVDWLVSIGVGQVCSLRFKDEVKIELKKQNIQIVVLENQQVSIMDIIKSLE